MVSLAGIKSPAVVLVHASTVSNELFKGLTGNAWPGTRGTHPPLLHRHHAFPRLYCSGWRARIATTAEVRNHRPVHSRRTWYSFHGDSGSGSPRPVVRFETMPHTTTSGVGRLTSSSWWSVCRLLLFSCWYFYSLRPVECFLIGYSGAVRCCVGLWQQSGRDFMRQPKQMVRVSRNDACLFRIGSDRYELHSMVTVLKKQYSADSTSGWCDSEFFCTC